MPVNAAGKTKTINLKAGQTCYVTSKKKSGKKPSGSIQYLDITPTSSKAKYDLLSVTPAKNKYKSSKFFVPDLTSGVYYKKIKGNDKYAVTCTAGKLKVVVEDYKGQVTIKKNSKPPYQKKTIKQGSSKTLKPDVYCMTGKAGLRYSLWDAKDDNVTIHQITYLNKSFRIKQFYSEKDLKSGSSVSNRKLSYTWTKKVKTRSVVITMSPIEGLKSKIYAEKGDITLYSLKL